MATANRTNILDAYRRIYGRRPTEEEYASAGSIDWGNTSDYATQLANKLQAEGTGGVSDTGVTRGSLAEIEARAASGGSPTNTLPQTTAPTQPQGTAPAPTFSYPQFSYTPTVIPPQIYGNQPYSPSAQTSYGAPSGSQYYNSKPFTGTSAAGATAPSTAGIPGFEGYKGTAASPASGSVSAPTPSNVAQKTGDKLNDMLADVKNYVADMEKEARGDYDFIIKYLDRQHRMALGTDDAARAQFFEAVSNELETKIGRIPFDYLQKTDREKENLSNIFRRNSLANRQIDTQEQEFNDQQKYKSEQEKEQIQEAHSDRGLVGSGIEKKAMDRAAMARKLFETDPTLSRFGFQRETLGQGLYEDVLGSNRRMEDIQTGSRRGAQDFIFDQDKAREGSVINLQKRLGEIAREGQQEEGRVRAIYNQEELFNKAYG